MRVVTYSALAQKIGRHEFAYLRSVAEGLPLVDAARRYLAIDHAAEAKNAHDLAVDRVRAFARRRRESAWRLIGIEIRDKGKEGTTAPPPLYEWAESEGLDGWSEAELLDLYNERFGQDDPKLRRRRERNQRLRKRRMALLAKLEEATERPAPTDLLVGWLPPELADALRRGGTLTLGDLQRLIARGGRWWRTLPAFGPTKAKRLAKFVELLLGAVPAGLAAQWSVTKVESELARYTGRQGANRAVVSPGGAGIDAEDDRQAVRAWIAARAGSEETARYYESEAERFILFCVLERHKAMSDANADDCRAYMDFLADVPEAWISRRKVPRLAPGWAPFKGPLTIASQTKALRALHSLFKWLEQAKYLAVNPWHFVNRKLGDDPRLQEMSDEVSRAFTPAAWRAMHTHLDESKPSPSVGRLRWICTFEEAVGLRATELLAARRGHFVRRDAGWAIRVHGKGRKNRTVPVPAVAMEATRQYFRERGLDFDAAPADTPLLASLVDPLRPISYQALHQTFTRFVRNAIQASALSSEGRQHAERASSHWLRHTHATRAAERDVPEDVLRENLGQKDPRTTARYYRAQIDRRHREMERAFPGPGADKSDIASDQE